MACSCSRWLRYVSLFFLVPILGLVLLPAYSQSGQAEAQGTPQCSNPPSGASEAGSKAPAQSWTAHLGKTYYGANEDGTQNDSFPVTVYQVNGSSFTLVEGSWAVPAVNCTEVPDSSSAFWVGFDGGSGTSYLEQIGTTSTCVGGIQICEGKIPCFFAWYEFLPKQKVGVSIDSIKVKAGDTISASVSYSNSTDRFTVTITDGHSLALAVGIRNPLGTKHRERRQSG
jgi:hypothetical protein